MIGSTLAHCANRLGQRFQSTVVDAMLPLYGGNLQNLAGINGQIEFVQGDIRDLELMERPSH